MRERFGEAITPADLSRIIITHGHIDHFGGLTALRHHTTAPIGIHELDRRVLQNYEERLVIASKNLRIFLERAGVRAERRDELMSMYTIRSPGPVPRWAPSPSRLIAGSQMTLTTHPSST